VDVISEIVLCLRWHLRYPLSYRNLEEMMVERGLTVDHSTIARWVLRYAPVRTSGFGLKCEIRTARGGSTKPTFGLLGSGPIYIAPSTRPAGNTIHFLLSPYRDAIAAKTFLQLAIAQGGRIQLASTLMGTRRTRSQSNN
jgi:transposase-like protein